MMEQQQLNIGLMFSSDGETMILMILKDTQELNFLIIPRTTCLFILPRQAVFLVLI